MTPEEKLTQAAAPASNEISAQTGEFDARFMLWRLFCSQTGVAVETLPSELRGEMQEKWEKLKEEHLHKPTEGRT